MLEDSLRIRKVYNFRLNYLENREILDDSDKLIFHEEFILLNDYEMTMTILNDLRVRLNKIISMLRIIYLETQHLIKCENL